MIQVTNLRKRFDANEVLKGINFEVAPQTILGIIGASGSGKTISAVSTGWRQSAMVQSPARMFDLNQDSQLPNTSDE
jgi:ABC-type glutathione transport system ATPase component